MSSTDSSSSSSSSIVTIDNYIAGQYVCPQQQRYMNLYSPADGQQFAKVALSDEKDVDVAVQAAKKAYEKWSKLTVKARVQYLYKFHQLLIDHQSELVDLIVKEHGKTRGEAIGSIQKGNETVEWACSLPQLMQGKLLEVSTGVHCHDVRESHGVVVSIVPFNFPIMVPMWTLPIAIAAGNTLILKPSEKVPMTLNFVMQLLKKTGLPDGVVNLVNGQAEVVNALCDHDDVKAVTFVGSSKVAELVAQRCHRLNKRVLALGAAKNHLIALPDCNIDMCSSDIVSSFTGCAGQRCMAASALILVKQQPELLDLIVQKAAKLQPGQDNAGQMGPLIDDAAKQRVLTYINEAESKYGAKVLLDGRSWSEQRQQGYWVGPTILLHQSPSDPAFTEEIFGPVLSVYVAQTREEAIEIENRSPYGNAACIYTTVGAHAEWFTSRFHAGMIGVNVGVPVPREPFSFGGWNRSRFGDLDITGDGGLEFFTKKRKITTKWNLPANRGLNDWMS